MSLTTLGLQILAMHERLDTPESWVHLCVTAAEEAQSAVGESEKLPMPSQVLQALGHVREIGWDDESWQAEDILKVANAYAVGKLRQAQAGADAASVAFRANLPHITNRRSVQAFVSCVAVGVLRGFITVKDANSLLFAAQAALSAFPKRKPRQGRK